MVESFKLADRQFGSVAGAAACAWMPTPGSPATSPRSPSTQPGIYILPGL